MLRVVSGYNLGLADRYAAIFEKMAMSGSDITVVHPAVTAFTPFVARSWSPRLSLSISLGGQIMFRHGFCMAETDFGIVVGPTVRQVAGQSSVNLTTMEMEMLELSRPGTVLDVIEYLQTVLINASRSLVPSC
jgi:hypothetical protein